MKKVSLNQVLVMNAYWVGLSFMWTSLHVIILPAVLLHLVPEAQKNTYLGLLTFFGLIIAMIIQPVSGALSDGWSSRWGRRRPLIAAGALFNVVFLAFLGWSGGLVWIAIGYLGLQFTSNLAHGPMQGLLPDRVPPIQLGWASGIKNLMDMVGLIAASLLVGRLIVPETRHPVVVIILVTFLLLSGAAATLFGTPEEPSLGIPRRSLAKALQDSLLEPLRVNWRQHQAFAWLIALRFFFLTGVYGIQTFAQYFVRDVIRAENPIQLTGDLLVAITVALVIFSVAGGWMGDRWGHHRVSAAASLIGGVGCFLLLAARTPETLLLFGGITGAGVGLFLTANWAMAMRLSPPSQAGKFLGLTNLATAGAGAFGRLEGPMIDVLNNLVDGAWLGYTALFILAGVAMFVSAVLLRQVMRLSAPAVLSTADQGRFQ
jgi:MFS family permease